MSSADSGLASDRAEQPRHSPVGLQGCHGTVVTGQVRSAPRILTGSDLVTPAIVLLLTAVFTVPGVLGGHIVARKGDWPAGRIESREVRTAMVALGWFLLAASALLVVLGIVTLLIRS